MINGCIGCMARAGDKWVIHDRWTWMKHGHRRPRGWICCQWQVVHGRHIMDETWQKQTGYYPFDTVRMVTLWESRTSPVIDLARCVEVVGRLLIKCPAFVCSCTPATSPLICWVIGEKRFFFFVRFLFFFFFCLFVILFFVWAFMPREIKQRKTRDVSKP